jgi:hypothetical protein
MFNSHSEEVRTSSASFPEGGFMAIDLLLGWAITAA